VNGADLTKAVTPVEIARSGIEIRDAGKEVGGSGEDDPFDVGEQRPPETFPLPRRRDGQQFEVIPEQKMAPEERQPRHVLGDVDDVAFPPRREGIEETLPMVGRISEALPGIRIGQHLDDGDAIFGPIGSYGRLNGHDRSPPASIPEIRDGHRLIPARHDLVIVQVLNHLTGMDAFSIGMHHDDAPAAQS
jgi:hypothetical protein